MISKTDQVSHAHVLVPLNSGRSTPPSPLNLKLDSTYALSDTYHEIATNNPTANPAPPADADPAVLWAFLEERFRDIMAESQTVLHYCKSLTLYTAVYDTS